jgi:hypothetical protein
MIQTTSRVRWDILAFLFVATAILYIDRSALGILAPELQFERFVAAYESRFERAYGYFRPIIQ